ncbi:MCP domain signal transducer [Natrarchaeobaculum sulfurireducens]|uniref:MCP domain signal transducer n=1 Tax=Natrarchaeobaculum sulfurireducens TaxID=2044521 RepID=A0A346PEN5_9EURY|nr:methyl-accepting chemotaxis protein [Natrarchaeobaculum sulfurireducens]AXR77980.1 Methyl-accepting chemotaxis protein [Natrarchaeobaculum sulfurireducens]AXR82025.1 MCP domain signal transducer [Natrarchaeobaculum sulfurireducens]
MLLALSVGLVGLVGTAAVTESVEGNALEEYETLAEQEATAIQNWDERNEQLVQSAMNTVHDRDSATVDAYIQDFYYDLPGEAQAIHYVDTTSGELEATTADGMSTLEDIDFPDELSPENPPSSVERTDAYENSEGSVVSYYVGLEDEPERAIVVTFELHQHSTNMATRGNDDAVTVLVDGDDRIIADDEYLGSDDDAFGTEYVDDNEVINEARLDATGTTDNVSAAQAFEGSPSETLADEPYNFSADEYVAAYGVVNSDWIVLIHASDDEAYGFVNTVSQYGVVATVAGVLMIGVVGAILGRNTATSIDRLTRKATRMEEGDLDVEFETKRIDNIGRLYDGFDSMRVALRDQIEAAESARQEAERERARVAEINDQLERKASEYSDVMQTAADGDLTARMDPGGDNEAMTEIGREFNEMLDEIEATVERLNQFATDVATASEQVTASSEEVGSASQEVAESTQEISDGADRQHQALQTVDAQMNTLSTTTEQIAASSNSVADIAEQTAQTTHEGRAAAQKAVDACEALEDEQRAAVEEFEALEEEVDQIIDLTDTIAGIATQTNMLALNANIEASRSSSSNDTEGFSTVAAEVKELSQDVKRTAEQIDKRLDSVQTQTQRSAQEIDHTSEEIERVNDLVSNAVDALDEIATYADKTNNGVQEISAATQQQAASTQEAVAMVDDVATVSEETTAEAQTVAAAAEEQTSALTEMVDSAESLTQQAVHLSAALDRFDTDADDSADDLIESVDGGTEDHGASFEFSSVEAADEIDTDRSQPSPDGK